jgi:hypothetical protein
MTLSAIARKFGAAGISCVRTKLVSAGVNTRGYTDGPKILPSSGEVTKLYVEEGWSTPKIAKKFGVTYGAVRLHLLAQGIKLRNAKISQERHGKSDTPEYYIWRSMIQRCRQNGMGHKDYGQRGIKVYGPWRTSFQKFLSYVGPRPTPAHSIDRFPNNDGDYEPGNVRWATIEEQQNNKRSSRFITIEAGTKTVREWEKARGFKINLIAGRLRRGYSPDEAINTPVGELDWRHK